ELTAGALTEMRLLIHELRPPVLETQGLVPALQARLAAGEGRAGLGTGLVAEPSEPERLPPAPEQEVCGGAQEALKNDLKHAHPERVVVTVRQTRQMVSVEVMDDGSGFDLASAQDGGNGGMGLVGMRERAARLGGQLSISSNQSAGTTVLVEVP